MSVDRFKGEEGMAFVGSPTTKDQTAEIHMYSHRNYPMSMLMDTFKIEDIVAAVNALPGVTATYTPPEPPLPELPTNVGAIVRVDGIAYVRDGFDRNYPWSAANKQSEYPDSWYGFKTHNLVIVSRGVE